MTLTTSPTELTTSATDAVLAIQCVVVLAYLWRTPTGDRWRVGLWCWLFGSLAFASVVGALTHGLATSHLLRAALRNPLYLSLGLVVGLFLVGAFYDWRGRVVAERLVPWSIALGIIFFGVTVIFDGAFITFLLYEAVAMAISLMIYSFLAATSRLKGAGVVATAIFINLVAAGIQNSNISIRLWIPFDHNGVFHLVQMVGLATLGLGLRMGMKPDARRDMSKQSLEANALYGWQRR